jgi:hypothetical protein
MQLSLYYVSTSFLGSAGRRSVDLAQKIGCSPRRWIMIERPEKVVPILAFPPSGFLEINPWSSASAL